MGGRGWMVGGAQRKERGERWRVVKTLRSLHLSRSMGWRRAAASLPLPSSPSPPRRHNPSSAHPPCPKCVATLNNSTTPAVPSKNPSSDRLDGRRVDGRRGWVGGGAQRKGEDMASGEYNPSSAKWVVCLSLSLPLPTVTTPAVPARLARKCVAALNNPSSAVARSDRVDEGVWMGGEERKGGVDGGVRRKKRGGRWRAVNTLRSLRYCVLWAGWRRVSLSLSPPSPTPSQPQQ